jgi:hypothetical protein
LDWLCLTHFPDGTERIRVVPWPAPMPERPEDDRMIVKIDDEPGLWVVRHVNTHVVQGDYSAEIWVRPATNEELTSSALPAPETITE